MKNNVINNKKIIIYTFIEMIVLIAFSVIVMYTGYHHEHWADEAQTWLIARDNSFFGIISAMRYEGSPAGWPILLKGFQLLGLTYDYFFLVPIILTVIGLIILEYKIDIPIWAKVLVPFSFFIIFQLSVVARSYSMILPCLMIICYYYKDMLKKPLPYLFSVIILSTSSSYALMLAGSFYLIFLINIFYEFKRKKGNDLLPKSVKRKLIALSAVTFFAFLIITIFLVPPKDIAFSPIHDSTLFYIVTNTFLFDTGSNISYILFTILIFAFIIWYFKKNIVNVLIIFLPVFLYEVIFYSHEWHYSVMYLALLSCFLLFNDDKKGKKEKCFQSAVCVILLSIQIVCGALTINYDINNNYTAAPKANELISAVKDNDENVSIYASDFYSIALQPYYSKNIYVNRPNDKTYYFFSYNDNKKYYVPLEDLARPQDLFIYSNHKILTNEQKEKLNLTDSTPFEFKGGIYFKTKIISNRTFYIYISNKYLSSHPEIEKEYANYIVK